MVSSPWSGNAMASRERGARDYSITAAIFEYCFSLEQFPADLTAENISLIADSNLELARKLPLY